MGLSLGLDVLVEGRMVPLELEHPSAHSSHGAVPSRLVVPAAGFGHLQQNDHLQHCIRQTDQLDLVALV